MYVCSAYAVLGFNPIIISRKLESVDAIGGASIETLAYDDPNSVSFVIVHSI